MDRIDIIDKEIDRIVLASPLFSHPLPYCVWALLIMHEEYCRIPFLTKSVLPSENPVFSLYIFDSAKYALKYSLSWAYCKAKTKFLFNIPQNMAKENYENAANLFKVGIEYMNVVTAFISYRRKKASATLIDENTIKFERNPGENRYDALDKIISSELETETIQNNLPSLVKFGLENNTLESFVKSIHQVYDAGINYELPAEVVKEYAVITEGILKPSFLFPPNWRFHGISIETFRKIWTYLVAWCSLHILAHICAALQLQIRGGAFLTTILTRNTNEFNAFIYKIDKTIPLDSIKEVVKLMTYDTNIDINKRDPALQPIIPLGYERIGICPQLICSSNIERNMMVLLAHHYNDEYSATTNILEKHLISEIYQKIKKTNLLVATNKRIPQHEELPDIDLAIYDQKSSIFLFVELKWTLRTSETGEIIEKIKIEDKGKQQIKELLNFANNYPQIVMSTCFPKMALNQGTRFFGCVAIRGFCGTNESWEEALPVIEESLLIKSLLEETNLENAIQWIKSREFLPIQDKDFRNVEIKSKIGDYEIIWSGYSFLGLLM